MISQKELRILRDAVNFGVIDVEISQQELLALAQKAQHHIEWCILHNVVTGIENDLELLFSLDELVKKLEKKISSDFSDLRDTQRDSLGVLF